MQKRMRHIAICGLSECAVVCHIIPQTERILEEKKFIERKMCVLIFSTNFV
jgi:hypothetical protein